MYRVLYTYMYIPVGERGSEGGVLSAQLTVPCELTEHTYVHVYTYTAKLCMYIHVYNLYTEH